MISKRSFLYSYEIFLQFSYNFLKFRVSRRQQKFEKNILLVLTLLSKHHKNWEFFFSNFVAFSKSFNFYIICFINISWKNRFIKIIMLLQKLFSPLCSCNVFERHIHIYLFYPLALLLWSRSEQRVQRVLLDLRDICLTDDITGPFSHGGLNTMGSKHLWSSYSIDTFNSVK